MAEVKDNGKDRGNSEARLSQASDLARTKSISKKWRKRFNKLELVCPFCKGKLEFHGVTRSQIYRFAEERSGVIQPFDVDLIIFVCHRCGCIEKFKDDLFDPADFAKPVRD